jgi:hypothetical protein
MSNPTDILQLDEASLARLRATMKPLMEIFTIRELAILSTLIGGVIMDGATTDQVRAALSCAVDLASGSLGPAHLVAPMMAQSVADQTDPERKPQ